MQSQNPFQPSNLFQQYTYITNYISNNTFVITIRDNYHNIQYSINYSPFLIDTTNITKQHIEKRQIIYRNFIFNTNSTLEAILQTKIYEGDNDYILIGNHILYLKKTYCQIINNYVNMGFWIENPFLILDLSFSFNNRTYGHDIISLYSVLKHQSYSQSILELDDYFATHKFDRRRENLFPKEFQTQEKNPISLEENNFFDIFHSHFTYQEYTLCNAHRRIIEKVYKITAADSMNVCLHYTFWRHNNSSIYQMLPIPPQRPFGLYYSLNDIQYIHDNENVMIVDYSNPNTELDNRIIKNNLLIHFGLSKFCICFLYGGIKNIGNHHNTLFGKKIHFFLDETITYSDIKNAYQILKEIGVKSCSFFETGTVHESIQLKNDILHSSIIDIKEILESKNTNYYNEEDEDLFYSPSRKIPEPVYQRSCILEPIIDSGTNTWIFAKEKVGKTILALTIAQAVGMGNSQVGYWQSTEARKVLYMDGEMSAYRINEHINKICNAYDPSGNVERAFSIYSFADDSNSYTDILDERWQEKYFDRLFTYNLIIIDNYYSLIDSQNPLKFIKWMKRLNKKGVAFIILDHTNAEGEIQGSANKRRAMDLGIKLASYTDKEITIEYVCDRYGKHTSQDIEKLIKDFTQTSFTFHISTCNTDDNYSRSDIFDAAILLLKRKTDSNDKIYTNKKVADILETTQSRISKRLSSIGYNYRLQDSNNITKEILKKRNIIEKIIDIYSGDIDTILKKLHDLDTIQK